MEFLNTLKHCTPDECREIGEFVLSLADSPRDAAWHANLDRIMAKFQSPEELGMAEQLSAARTAVADMDQALRADGMDYETLAEAELRRRGDKRSFEQWRSELSD